MVHTTPSIEASQERIAYDSFAFRLDDIQMKHETRSTNAYCGDYTTNDTIISGTQRSHEIKQNIYPFPRNFTRFLERNVEIILRVLCIRIENNARHLKNNANRRK